VLKQARAYYRLRRERAVNGSHQLPSIIDKTLSLLTLSLNRPLKSLKNHYVRSMDFILKVKTAKDAKKTPSKMSIDSISLAFLAAPFSV